MARIKTRPRRDDQVRPLKYTLKSNKKEEEERRILSSRSGENMNTLKKLRRRELGERSRVSLGRASHAPEMLRNIKLQEEYNMYGDSLNWSLRRRYTAIKEITSSGDVIFVLAESGIGAAFSRSTNRRICFLNTSPDQEIQIIYFNKYNDSLITVSTYGRDDLRYLRCKTIHIEYIRRNQMDAEFSVFETESLTYDDSVELDGLNGKALIYNSNQRIYKVYDLKNYSFLYSISNPNEMIANIKMRSGIMLIIFWKHPDCPLLRLKMLSIEDGKELTSFTFLLSEGPEVEFVELFNENLLVKRAEENLVIFDVHNLEVVDVKYTGFMKYSSFMFLYETQRFLSFQGRIAEVWNFQGEVVTEFEDHPVSDPECDSNIFHISSDEELIISYCKGEGELFGSISMSNMRSGNCIAKISPNDPMLKISPHRVCDPNRSLIRSTIKEALEEVTVLFYDEDLGVLYTGNEEGLVHVWHT